MFKLSLCLLLLARNLHWKVGNRYRCETLHRSTFREQKRNEFHEATVKLVHRTGVKMLNNNMHKIKHLNARFSVLVLSSDVTLEWRAVDKIVLMKKSWWPSLENLVCNGLCLFLWSFLSFLYVDREKERERERVSCFLCTALGRVLYLKISGTFFKMLIFTSQFSHPWF